jgi:pentatricopeptide repeat protein
MNNVELQQSINPFLADLGASLVFGLGFYFFKKHFRMQSTDKEVKDKIKPLRLKIEDTINKWESSISLQKINSILKNEVNDKNFDPFLILDQLRNNNIIPDISTINILLDTCSRLKDFLNFNRLKQLIFEEDSFAEPNIVTFNIMLKGINYQMANLEFKSEFAKNNIEVIFREMNKKDLKPNDITLNTIIDILVEASLFGLAWKYFDDMKTIYELEPDIYTYSTLLKSLKNHEPEEMYIERAFDILKLVKLSKTKGIKPDEILYNCIIETCVKYGRMNRAEDVYEDMISFGVSPSKITYSIMIRGYGNDYNLSKAFCIYSDMKEKAVLPNDIIYGCLLNACVKCNMIEKACEIYDEIKQSNIEMNLIIYSTLIKGYTKIKNFDKAIEIYNKLIQDKTISTNIITYNAILDSCVECGNFDMMTEIYDNLKKNAIQDESASQPDLITYSTVIKGYSRMKNIEKVMDIYNYLRNRNDMILDEVVYNSILDGLLKSSRYHDALNLYEDMRKNNIKRSNATFSILIKIFSKMDDVEKAIAVYNEMISEKVKPSLITYTSIIQILIKSKRINTAIQIFGEILTQKLNPDQVMFNVIINGCVFNGKLDEACKLLLESFKANIKLCNDVYKNVLCNLLTNKTMEFNYKINTALKICKELKLRGLKVEYELYHKVIKMCYKGKNSESFINKELEEYKSSTVKEESNYKKQNFDYEKPRQTNNNSTSGFNKGEKWRK